MIYIIIIAAIVHFYLEVIKYGLMYMFSCNKNLAALMFKLFKMEAYFLAEMMSLKLNIYEMDT